MTQTIASLTTHLAVQPLWQQLTKIDALVDLAVAVQQIPAPTFDEANRAGFIAAKFVEARLQDVSMDDLYNVYGRYPSANPTHPPVIISAHSDTVFPRVTDLTVRRDGRIIHGPGIGDNSTGVAGIIHLAQLFTDSQLALPADLWFVSNVGEEGLGDLRGMRAVVERFGGKAIYLVVEGGLFGQVSHQAIGVRRFEVILQTPGGHSWGSFGKRSAIHEMAHLIAEIDRLPVPQHPKTTYNVGIVEGGTSINSIANSAQFLLDLRSESPDELKNLVAQVERLVVEANRRKDVSVQMTLIGNRPAGQLPESHPLVRQALEALQAVGFTRGRTIASSTDANVPLSRGFTAVCIGLAESGNAHRPDEYVDMTQLTNGMRQLLLLTLAAAQFS